jgi:predicted RNA-binding protein with PUA-like domain
MPKNYWVVKSEPGTYSIDDLARDGETGWEGVRNFQARNYMMNDMSVGDLVLFYHSNSNPSGIYGTARVSSPAHQDLTALDPQDDHFDSRSTPDHAIWECIDLTFERKADRPLSLENMRLNPRLSSMEILKKGSRLSVSPVSKEEFAEATSLIYFTQ